MHKGEMHGLAAWNVGPQSTLQQPACGCIGGDPAVWDRLARPYRRYFINIAGRVLSDRHNAGADDLARDARFILFRKLVITGREATRVTVDCADTRVSRASIQGGWVLQWASRRSHRRCVTGLRPGVAASPRQPQQVMEAIALGDRPCKILDRIGVAECTVGADIRQQLSIFLGTSDK